MIYWKTKIVFSRGTLEYCKWHPSVPRQRGSEPLVWCKSTAWNFSTR